MRLADLIFHVRYKTERIFLFRRGNNCRFVQSKRSHHPYLLLDNTGDNEIRHDRDAYNSETLIP